MKTLYSLNMSYFHTLAFFLLSIAVTFFVINLGFWIGSCHRKKIEGELDGSVGNAVGATLGLLAFMMAFTFGAAADRYQNRKEFLLEEVNSIHSDYLRAGLLLEPHKTEVRKLLREYVDLRAEVIPGMNPEDFGKIVKGSEAIQKNLWEHAMAIAEKDRSSEIDALFISELTEVIKLGNRRLIVGTQYRIPAAIYATLILIHILAMILVGFQFGLSGKRSPIVNLILALAFSAIFWLIFDLDNQTGFIQVRQRPMLELKQRLNAEAL